MKTFSDLLEAPQTIVFAFGRFNPPTIGHEKLIDKTASVAGKVPYRIYPSFTTNPKKDPLPHALKIAYMRKMFPKYRSNIVAGKERNVLDIAVSLHNKGHLSIVMVVGSDRKQDFESQMRPYLKDFGIDKFSIVSSGERDADASDVSGVSASKARALAKAGD